MRTTLDLKNKIPNEVLSAAEILVKAGFEAYLVGGCVRDLLLNRTPKDWDITTNATPDEIQKLYSETFYENDYGTVGVVNKETQDESLRVIEITPYRLEAEYSDKRRPDSVTFSKILDDDLKRRDFTINAIAYDPIKCTVVDLYLGQKDIKDKVIRTVGNPVDRFNEDGLRILRGIRLFAELGFAINSDTERAIQLSAQLLEKISKERIRDEFTRIVMSPNPMIALFVAQKLGVLKYIVPELEKSIGIEQNKAHAFHVWEHLLRSLQHSADKNYSLEVRLAALFHDIGKPDSRRKSLETGDWTFYGHEVIGARMAEKILKNLKYPTVLIDRVRKLVRWHMFFSDTEQITLSAVRRMIANVGQESVWDLMNVRICDRIGTGRPKENPYRLRKYKSMIEEAMRDPVSVGMLKIDGAKIMEMTKMKPGPKIGWILHALLEEVLEDPTKNVADYLGKRVMELEKMPDAEVKSLGEKAKEKKAEEEERELREIRKRYGVE